MLDTTAGPPYRHCPALSNDIARKRDLFRQVGYSGPAQGLPMNAELRQRHVLKHATKARRGIYMR